MSTPAPPIDVPAVIYARISKEEKNSLSVAGQIQRCREYCQLKGYYIAAEYVDANVSGATAPLTRAQGSLAINRAIAAAKIKKKAKFIVAKTDRFGRDIYTMLQAVAEMGGKNVDLESASESYDLRTPEGLAAFHMFSLMATFELGKIRSRTSEDAKMRKNLGWRVSSSPPFGKRFVPAKDANGNIILSTRNLPAMRLEDDPIEQECLANMLRLYHAGYTFTDIAMALNNRGLLRRNNKPWDFNTARRAFRSFYGMDAEARRVRVARKRAPLPPPEPVILKNGSIYNGIGGEIVYGPGEEPPCPQT